MAATFLWYDLETFGTHPGWDRIAQFAALRTDEAFQEVAAPELAYCRISPDYLPHPEACLITGITPRITGERGVVEAEFAALLQRQMRVPGTCIVGYNTARFDDEFVRNLFYRNFYDPYAHEYAAGNSRWDIIDLARITHDLRPDGVQWVYHEDGRPDFRLERLSAANGLEHESAHDALSDVRVTLALATLLHEKQPRLFAFHFGLRKKEAVRRLLNLQNPQPVVLAASTFTRPGACSSVVYPIAVDPVNANRMLCYDLRFDPAPLIDGSIDEVRKALFSSAEQRGVAPRVALTDVHLNRCPALAPLSTLDAERAAQLGIDLAQCEAVRKRLAAHPELAQKVREVYKRPVFKQYDDPDLNIYAGGFFGDEDRIAFERIRAAEPAELAANPPHFQDPRGYRMLRTYIARNYPQVLSPEDRDRWRTDCARRLLGPEFEQALDFRTFQKRVQALFSAHDTSPRHKLILKDLLDYAAWLERHVLSPAG